MINSDKETQQQEAIVHFNGGKYKLAALLKLAKVGPSIDVNATDINFFVQKEDIEGNERTLSKEELVQINNCDPEELKKHGIVFYRQHGTKKGAKYTVLVGQSHLIDKNGLQITSGMIKGKLISTVALKSIKIAEQQSETQQVAEIPKEQPKAYPEDFSNRPRFTNDKRKQHYSSSDRNQTQYKPTRNDNHYTPMTVHQKQANKTTR